MVYSTGYAEKPTRLCLRLDEVPPPDRLQTLHLLRVDRIFGRPDCKLEGVVSGAKFREPRIHWALVCAAVGCPPMRQEVYTGERLEEQLEDQSWRVHTDERWFRFDRDRGEVWLTSLYNWYSGDYEQVAGSVLDYAAQYSPKLRQALDAGERPRIRWIEYDWALNIRENAP